MSREEHASANARRLVFVVRGRDDANAQTLGLMIVAERQASFRSDLYPALEEIVQLQPSRRLVATALEQLDGVSQQLPPSYRDRLRELLTELVSDPTERGLRRGSQRYELAQACLRRLG